MDFEFDEATRQYRDVVADFAAREVAPHYQDDDRRAALRPELRGRLAELGLLGLRVPGELGGQDADCVTTGAVIEELARADLNAAYLPLLAALVTEILTGTGRSGRYLKEIAAGESLACLALSEPGHGSDAGALTMRAEPDGRTWLLTGEKTSVSLGRYADTAVVFARTGGQGPAGVSAFYVDLDDRYVSRGTFDDLGSRAIGRAALRFDHLPAGEDRLLGALGEGFGQVMRGFDYSRALIGLMCLGAARASLDEAVDWAREREAFGAPIGRYQGVAFPLVEQVTKVRAARHLCYEALVRKDRGLDHGTHAAMAKWWAPKVAAEAAHQALLTFGHAGYSQELPLGQRLRDIIGLEIGDGTAQVAKLVVARDLLGKQSAP